MGKRRPSGDGMVRKRDDGRWEGRIVVGHKANGDPIFRHVYAKTQKALTEKLHQSIECYQNVELTEDSRMTLGEWLDRWLAEYKDGTIRPGTLEGYRNYIENYIKPQLGGKQVSLITTQDVQRMYRRLKSGGRVREDAEGSKRLSDSTVRHIHTMLHGAMKAAVQAHIIPKNPTENATAPKLNYKPMQVLSEQELDTFLQAVQNDDVWRDFFYTELMTGLRRGEICALMWRDFDAKAGTLGISRTLHSKGQGIYALGDTKTSQGNRTIILPESVAALLRARKKASISQWIFPQPTSPELPMNPGTATGGSKHCWRKRDCRAFASMIFVIRSRHTPSPAAWTRKRWRGFWVTRTPASRLTPIRTLRRICAKPRAASSAASWRTYSERS